MYPEGVHCGGRVHRPVTTTLATPAVPTVTTQDGKAVITGSSVGVRIDRRDETGIHGTIVVKVDGAWQEVDLTPVASE